MYVKRNYGFWMTFNWSKMPFIYGFLYSCVLCSGSLIFPNYVSIPWEPISVIGIAVAFYLGFKNNSSYDRTWEARKVWGELVNNSRSFGAAVVSIVQGENSEDIKKELIYRHIAWITALRYQLRLSQPWEHVKNRKNGIYAPVVYENDLSNLENDLTHFLSKEEITDIEKKANFATQILIVQSKRLQELKDLNYFEDFRHMRFHDLVTRFYNDQGQSERIKNFPLPRQYASTALWLTLVFCVFVPLGVMDVFETNGLMMLLFCPLVSAIIIWIYFLMEKVGDYSENPFEGTYNDVPITSIARSIEIDLKEMINDRQIPSPLQDENGFLM